MEHLAAPRRRVITCCNAPADACKRKRRSTARSDAQTPLQAGNAEGMPFMTNARVASIVLTVGTALWINGVGVAGETKAVVGMSALLLSDPPDLKKTGEREPYGSTVEVLEQKTLGKDRFAKKRLADQTTPLGWLKVEGNLGHVKEFDPSMKPSDAVSVKGLEGLDLTMASIYNARGRYLKEQAAKLGARSADLAAV